MPFQADSARQLAHHNRIKLKRIAKIVNVELNLQLACVSKRLDSFQSWAEYSSPAIAWLS